MERYSAEWWERWTQIAEGIRHNAQRMKDEGERMAYLAGDGGWKEAEPGASFLSNLFQLVDAVDEIRGEARELEEDFPRYYDAMYDDDGAIL